jgi:hypothetical protein
LDEAAKGRDPLGRRGPYRDSLGCQGQGARGARRQIAAGTG